MPSAHNDPSHDVAFRFVARADVPALLQLFKTAFRRDLSAEYYGWQFLDPPCAPGSSVVAEQSGEIVAHAGYTARAARIAREEGLIFVKQTSMSHPCVRGTGIYSRLLSWAGDALRERGADLILSYPNANNHPVQIMRNDYRDIYQIPCLRYVPKDNSAAHGADTTTPGTLCRAPFDDAYGALNSISLLESGFAISRNAEYLTWRYTRRPDVNYYVIEDRAAGELTAALVWKYYPSESPTRIMAVDWLAAADAPDAAEVFAPLEAHAHALGLPIYTWQNVYERSRHKLLERRGFSLCEPVFYFGGFPVAHSRRLEGWDDYRNWHIGMGDVDVF